MKLNLDESLPEGTRYRYERGNREEAPEHLRALLTIDGVKSVFQVLDFISLERHPKADWQAVLSQARDVLGEAEGSSPVGKEIEPSDGALDEFGEITVYIQKIRGIPMQVKCVNGNEEFRFGLPERFQKAVMEAHKATTNLVFERQWVEQSPRYGNVEEVGRQVVEELAAAYDEKRLEKLVAEAFQTKEGQENKREPGISASSVLVALDHPEWEKRYQALEQFEPTLEGLPVLDKALHDPKPAIRRLAIVYLGFLESKEALPYLCRALLKDHSAIVRRTAGDCLSDLGDPDATPAMCEALRDPNKLVRWRAARFLYEVGDASAREALKAAVDDPEFEVRLQAKMALERIERGEEASGTVWQQMARRNEDQEENS